MDKERSVASDPSNFEKLHKVFTNVNDWLKFAEAKNGMLIALNAASIYGITKMLDLDFVEESTFIQGYLFWMIVQFVFSCVCALLAFIPRIKILKGGLYDSGKTPNAWFFEYLKGKTQEEIFLEITNETDISNATKFEKDLAEQIRQNSDIASKKYSYFTIALWITVSAYVTILLAGIYWLYNFMNN